MPKPVELFADLVSVMLRKHWYKPLQCSLIRTPAGPVQT
jgi:hypothetical protein